MKVAVSAEGNDLDSRISSVFGRCQCFVLAEVEEGKISDSYYLENPAVSQSGGAGTKAAQLIGDEGVDVLISGAIGPKAFSALEQWNMEMYEGEPGTVKENLHKLISDELDEFESPSGGARRGPSTDVE